MSVAEYASPHCTLSPQVVAVVMDMFTDVDIFKDMLDAGFKRRISIYIILDESNVKYFLQMCQRAGMHEGQLKNIRVQCIGGTEFHTRFSTKFRGALTQKFIFVDGDKAACGSYSFTWSAARTDRNVLTVLTGQVVESFDKEFQELYLLSKAVSLKSVTIEPEPEPEPITLPSVLPTSVAKKVVNPKYALVKAKDSVELGAGSSGNQSGTTGTESNKKTKPKPKEPQPEIKEANLHPALQNMEKANMFDYLPTWVEPEPESGSDVLGYINIIDPNIKNAQLSQMNRIKICDTSHATAQHMMMMQNKEQEAREQQAKLKSKKEQKPMDRAGPTQQPVKVAAPKSPKREKVAPEPIKKDEKLLSPPTTDRPEVKTPDRSPGAFAFLAVSQHLVSAENEGEKETGTGKDSSRPVPKPRTVPVKDFIGKNNEQSQVQTKGRGEQNTNSRPSTPKTPNGTHRTTHDPKDKKKEQYTSTTQNGVMDDEDDDEEYVSLSEHGSSSAGSTHANHCPSNTSSNSEDYVDAGSPHANKVLRRSNSEFVQNGNPAHFQRMLSDSHFSRRSYVSPLKDVQIPLELRMDENGRRRNQLLEEEIKRALDRTNKLSASIHGSDRTYANGGDQAKSLFQFRSRTPRSTVQPNTDRDSYHGNQQDTNQRHGQFRMDTANEMDGYHHPGKNAGAGPGDQMFWSSKDYGQARTGSPNLRRGMGSTPGQPSQFPEYRGGTDSFNTPFGIPYSKLSESKHLKSRLGGQGDFRRRGHKDH